MAFFTLAFNLKIILTKSFFVFFMHMKVLFIKYLLNVSQGPPNPGIRSVKVENGDVLKMDSQHFKNPFHFGFL